MDLAEIRDDAKDFLQYPSSCNHTFQELVALAILEDRPIHIVDVDVHISLTETMLIRNNHRTLRLIGPISTDGQRATIESTGHSIFQVNGKRFRLELENLNLIHSRIGIDKKEIGAVLFMNGTSICVSRNCEITSANGFAVWAVRHSACNLQDCSIKSISRSGCVAFGHSRLLLENCTIADCYQHGVCLRGQCVLEMKNCRIVNCRARALYGYENARICLNDCVIEGTSGNEHAAVDLLSVEQMNERVSVETTSLTAVNVFFKENNCHSISATGPGIAIQLENCHQYNRDTAQYEPLEAVHINRAPAVNRSSTMSLVSDDGLCMGSDGCLISGGLWEYHMEGDTWRAYSPEVSVFISSRYDTWLNWLRIEGNQEKEDRTSAPVDCQEETSLMGDKMQTTAMSPRGRLRFIVLPAPFQFYKIDFQTYSQINCQTFFSRRIRRQLQRPGETYPL